MTSPRKTGRPPKRFDNQERAEFLRLRRGGVGVKSALKRLGIGYRRYRRELEENPGFRDQALGADVEFIETLVERRYEAAVGGDARAQEFLIDRHDKTRRFAEATRFRLAGLGSGCAGFNPNMK